MAFATTWVVPEVLTPYLQQMFFHSSRYFKSGVVNEATIEGIANMGASVSVPFYQWFSEDQWKAKSSEITIQGMDDATVIHPVFRKYNAVKVLDLQTTMSKGNPILEATRMIDAKVTHGINLSLIAALQGGCAAVASNIVSDTGADPAATDITKLAKIFGDTIQQRKEEGMVLLMRSGSHAAYMNLGMVATPTIGLAIQDQIMSTGVFADIQGYPVIVDDDLWRTTSTTVGDALVYMVGINAMNSTVQKSIEIEASRNALLKADILSYGYARTVGINGINYKSAIADEGPTDTELRTSGNWENKFDSGKTIRVASIQTNWV